MNHNKPCEHKIFSVTYDRSLVKLGVVLSIKCSYCSEVLNPDDFTFSSITSCVYIMPRGKKIRSLNETHGKNQLECPVINQTKGKRNAV